MGDTSQNKQVAVGVSRKGHHVPVSQRAGITKVWGDVVLRSVSRDNSCASDLPCLRGSHRGLLFLLLLLLLLLLVLIVLAVLLVAKLLSKT